MHFTPHHAKKLALILYKILFVSALYLGATSVALADSGGHIGANDGYIGNNGASNNHVVIDGTGTPNLTIYGGMDVNSNIASSNTVKISGGTVKSVYGGMALIGASSNTVTITGGTITENVHGGMTLDGPANENTVTITGGTFNDTVPNNAIIGGTSFGETKNNTVYLRNADLATYNLFGGSNGASGNTLILSGKNKASSAQNFEHYRFLVNNTVNNGDTMLSVDSAVDLTDTTVGVAVTGSTRLQQGNSITLINQVTGTFDPKISAFNASDTGFSNLGTNTNAKAIVNTGLINSYEFDIGVDASALKATLTKAGVKKSRLAQAKALSEGMVGSVAFLNQASDLASGRGMDAAVAATSAIVGSGVKAASFGVAQGGHSRYKTGSHVNVDGAGIILGVAFNTDTNYGNFMLAPFVEAGWGNYGSYNSFSNAPSVSGHGDSYYYGLGSLVRFDFNDIAYGHPYVEGSLRVGHSKADFSSNDIKDSTGKRASYDSEGMYYGAHVGGGYVFNLTDKDTLDTYLKYFWTHQDSDTVKVLGDKVHFDAVDSSRLRAGTRYSHNVKVDGYDLKPYVGVAFEREFDGKARAKVNSYDVDSPTLKGNTGMLEVGLSFKPQSIQNMSIDFGLEAYTGRREGVVGSLKAYYAF